jgi:hypothetical protein
MTRCEARHLTFTIRSPLDRKSAEGSDAPRGRPVQFRLMVSGRRAVRQVAEVGPDRHAFPPAASMVSTTSSAAAVLDQAEDHPSAVTGQALDDCAADPREPQVTAPASW